MDNHAGGESEAADRRSHRCFECLGAPLGFILPARVDILGDNLGYF